MERGGWHNRIQMDPLFVFMLKLNNYSYTLTKINMFLCDFKGCDKSYKHKKSLTAHLSEKFTDKNNREVGLLY